MLKLLIFTLLVSTANSSVKDFEMPKYSTAMSRAVIDFIVNFYFNVSSTVNMYYVSQPENFNKTLDVMNEILYNVKTDAVIHIDNIPDFKLSAWKRISNIIFVDSLESFTTIYEHIDYKRFEYQGFYLIVVTVHVSEVFFIALKIFEALWTKKIINANVLSMPTGSDNEVSLYTYYPYSSSYCESVVPIQLNHFRGHRWRKKIVYFPKKLTNFYGCTLNVATFHNPPFMIINENQNGTFNIDGVEGILLRVLSQRFNFKVKLFVQKDLYGTVFENGTTTGAIRMIVDSEVNLTLGFFVSFAMRDAVMQPSFVYFTSNLLWIVPPGKPQSPIEKMANPLEYIVWMLSLLTIVIGFMLIALLKMQPMVIQKFVFGNNTQSPAMNFINMILGYSLHQLPKRNFSRFLFIIASVYFFIIRTCYSGGLVKFMQMDTREQHMMNTAELVKNNFTFYMKKATQFHVMDMPEVFQRSKVLSIPEYNAKLNDMLDDPYYDAAFLTTTGHLAYRNRILYPEKFHEFAAEPLYDLDIVLYMSLGSCLKVYFDQMLMKLVSSGLIDKWTSEFIDKRFLKASVKNDLNSLSFYQLEGAFQLLFIGLLIGFIAFCGENMTARNLWMSVRVLTNKRKLFTDSKKFKRIKDLYES